MWQIFGNVSKIFLEEHTNIYSHSFFLHIHKQTKSPKKGHKQKRQILILFGIYGISVFSFLKIL